MIVVLVVVQAENPLNPSHKTSRRSVLPPTLHERFPPLRLLSLVMRKRFSLAMRECGITCLFACLKCHFITSNVFEQTGNILSMESQ